MEHLGKYHLIRRLALGGMAEVFLAKAAGPKGFEKTLVVKRILPQLAEDQHFVEMFLSEAKIAAQLNHPNIVQIFDFGEADGSYFIAMEYVDGPNLRFILRRTLETRVRLPIPLCIKIVSATCEGLAYAHAFADPHTNKPLNLIHCDISPDNILISRNGAVKVVDFGIARAAGHGHHTKTGSLKGKVAYMSPEQIQAKGMDLRTDIFALGVVLYELLTGSKPFNAETEPAMIDAILREPIVPVSSRRRDVPDAISRIINRALAKDPEGRYRNCREMQRDLERFLVSARRTVANYHLAKVVKYAMEVYGATRASAAAGAPTATATGTDNVKTVAEGEVGSPIVPFSDLSGPVDDDTLTDMTLPEISVVLPRPDRRLIYAGIAGAATLAVLFGIYLIVHHSRSPEVAPAPPPEAQEIPQIQEPQKTTTNILPPAKPEPLPVLPAPIEKTNPQPPSEAQAAGDHHRPSHAVRPPRKSTRHASSETPRETTRDIPRDTSSFELESNPPASVKVNGKYVGQSPVTAKNLRAGRVRVEVYDARQGFDKEQVFDLSPGDNGLKRVVVALGKLEFRVRPYATVMVDGKSVGETPLPPVDVYEGKHSIRLVNRELNKEVVVPYVVKGGQSNIFKYNLAE